MAEFNIALIPGDGIGPEIVSGAVTVLDAVSKKYGHKFNYQEVYMGGCAIDKYGVPLPQETVDICKKSDSVLLGAVGGPKWDSQPSENRPEKGLLAGLYELPNLEGYLSEEEILAWVENQDLIPLQIVPLIDAKHIFSHVEWDMKGYLIRVAALEESADPKMIFAEISEVEKEYPIPAAFQAYAEQIQMRLGQDKYR